MTVIWLSRISRKLKPSPFFFLLTQSISDPLALISQVNPKLSEVSHKPTIRSQITETNFRFSNNRWIGDVQSAKKNYRSDLNVYFSSICTSSGSLEGANNGGKPQDDEKQLSWIDLYLPKSLRPYAQLARLDKPIGTWLLAWPCMCVYWKIKYVSRLQYLWEDIKKREIEIPEFVQNHEDVLEHRPLRDYGIEQDPLHLIEFTSMGYSIGRNDERWTSRVYVS